MSLTSIFRRRCVALPSCSLLVSVLLGGCYDGLDSDPTLDDEASTGAPQPGPGADDPGDRPSDPDEPSDPPTPAAAEIDAYVIGLGTPQTPANERIEGEPSPEQPEGDYVCSTRELSETKQFQEVVAFAANSVGLYPGAIVGGNSISTGAFTPKVLPRQPITFSASLEGVLDGAVSAEIDPSLSAFREAMAQILSANVVGVTPANLTFDLHEVYSEEQLGLALGIDVQWMTEGVAASFAFDEEETRSRFVVDFVQAYYTVDLDPPGRPSDFVDPSVPLQQVVDVIGDDPPAYVSSVTYGRLVYFAVTSSFSSQELRAALEFGFNGGVADVEGSASLTHSEVLAQTQITAFILGGNGEVAVQAIHGPEELRTFIEQGGSYSKDSPGAPIAYKLAYLADNTPARFALTTQTQVEECDRVSQNIRIGLERFNATAVGDAGGDLEIYGDIYAIDEDGNTYPLFEATGGNNVVQLPNGQSWPQQGEIASDIIPVVPQPGHHFSIYIDLWESDGSLGGHDSFGVRQLDLDFENGWRNDQHIVSLAQDDDQLEVVLSYRPVP